MQDEQTAARRLGFAVGDQVHTNGQAPADYRHRIGFITELGPADGEYRVEFEDGMQPTTGYLMARWLDR
jgi:hypothetical protein